MILAEGYVEREDFRVQMRKLAYIMNSTTKYLSK